MRRCANCQSENNILFYMINWDDENEYCYDCISSEKIVNPSGLGFGSHVQILNNGGSKIGK